MLIARRSTQEKKAGRAWVATITSASCFSISGSAIQLTPPSCVVAALPSTLSGSASGSSPVCVSRKLTLTQHISHIYLTSISN